MKSIIDKYESDPLAFRPCKKCNEYGLLELEPCTCSNSKITAKDIDKVIEDIRKKLTRGYNDKRQKTKPIPEN